MRHVSRLVWVLTLLPLLGCGDAQLDTGKVSGKVTIGGKAIANLLVTFSPLDSTAQVASGRTEDDGTYVLYSGVQGIEGAVPGKYKIVINDGSAAAGEDYMSGDGGRGDVSSSEPDTDTGKVPAEYTSVETTPKEVEVVLGENTFNLDL
ncbi:MAG: hypothetical protein VB878_01465 [Pirellulaceae bacterium]